MTVPMQRKRILVVGLSLIATLATLLTTARLSADKMPDRANVHAPAPNPAAISMELSSNGSVDSVDSTIDSPDEIVQNGFVIDRHSIALFEQIPDNYLTAAREMGVLFSDRSVGQNVNEALDCLTAASWADAPASCRRDYYDADWNWKTFSAADHANGLVPAQILFDPDPVKYNRSNWTFEFKGGSWSQLTQDFIQVLAPAYVDSKYVLSYQFSYLNVDAGDDIADPATGFFADTPNKYDVHDLEAYIAQHPDKVFVFWTSSLARGIGTQVSTDFNNEMRQYAAEHNKILFDMADITEHTHEGAACYDNRDGVEYCSGGGNCENHPDDGQNLLALCQNYTTEVDGGHLGSVSGAKIRVAKAFWVMMARIAGWDGGGTVPPTATSTATPTITGTRPADTATPTVTGTPPTPTMTVTGTPPTETPTPTVTLTPLPTSLATPPRPTATFAAEMYLPGISN